MRVVWFTVGWVSTGLGLVGVLLPLMPSTVFFLLAAVAFARSSPGAHRWLTTHPRLGPPIADWRAGGVIRRPAKRAAVAAMAAGLGLTIALGAPLWVLAVQAACLTAVAAFILTRPETARAR
jgi:uncharacterized membrane protein YbaN (DUF454 family)